MNTARDFLPARAINTRSNYTRAGGEGLAHTLSVPRTRGGICDNVNATRDHAVLRHRLPRVDVAVN